MKRKLLALSFLVAGFGWGQRQMDLSVHVSNPANNSGFDLNEVVNFNVQCTLGGFETLYEDDSLFVYATLNGDPIIFPPGNEDHLVQTGNLFTPGATININLSFAFSDGYENTTNELCFMVIAVNSADEIQEMTLDDNEDCINFSITENTAALAETNAETIIISPNPSSESFSIKGLNASTELIITDLSGKQFPIDETHPGEINCSSWPNGTYIVHIREKENIVLKRVVINH